MKPVDVGGGMTRRYVSVDGGMSDNIRPALYAAEYSAALASRVVGRRAGASPASSACTARAATSWSATSSCPATCAIGDLIAVPAAGAYSRSMASNYNHTPRPPVVSVRDGKVRTMLRRETLDDLLALDAGLAENEERRWTSPRR